MSMGLFLHLTQEYQYQYQHQPDLVEDAAGSRSGQAEEADWHPLRSGPRQDAHHQPALSHGMSSRVAAAADDDDDDSAASMYVRDGSASPPCHSYSLAALHHERADDAGARRMTDGGETSWVPAAYPDAVQVWGEYDRNVVSAEVNWREEDCYSRLIGRQPDEGEPEFAGSPYYEYVSQTPYAASISDVDICSLDGSRDLGASDREDKDWVVVNAAPQ
ncbi:hypothetical protein MYCTH_2297409 [Thermothelomyces thermophilus ATCC 42464]|uniref:Uncharacterized protein n=1 Tax=Thermothelomyces thermophilus (strain ATCC 42464 / BCRC 31852 / DSM 1799) TaxID=573729 RepID=G2Q5K4_THET4|nr:uncharacterized protein MYCTH_2297409 [Thermothelomyces thermophilus ATCC 42464]AEO54637.1 hypothetical protein MYCTH_2297409 [Thermothelomyces thermophilus ATCC 42464]